MNFLSSSFSQHLNYFLKFFSVLCQPFYHWSMFDARNCSTVVNFISRISKRGWFGSKWNPFFCFLPPLQYRFLQPPLTSSEYKQHLLSKYLPPATVVHQLASWRLLFWHVLLCISFLSLSFTINSCITVILFTWLINRFEIVTGLWENYL